MPVIKAESVQVRPQSVLIDGERHPRKAAVVLKREGDEIRSIEVTCGCGKTIVLDCVYDQVVAEK